MKNIFHFESNYKLTNKNKFINLKNIYSPICHIKTWPNGAQSFFFLFLENTEYFFCFSHLFSVPNTGQVSLFCHFLIYSIYQMHPQFSWPPSYNGLACMMFCSIFDVLCEL